MNEKTVKINVVFVCLGNICRSPLAEGVFISVIQSYGLSSRFIVDSAGTSDYHVGELPDERAIKVARLNNISLNHRSRQFTADDFEKFDYILVMDHLNYDVVLNLTQNPEEQKKIFLFRSFDETALDDYSVPDPYYGGESDFDEVLDIVSRASKGFIRFLKHECKL